MPADAFRDKPFLDWIYATKGEDEQTVEDFNDLMYQNFEQIQAAGGLRALDSSHQKIESSQTYGNADKLLEKDGNLDAVLMEL